jgi:LytS/YehU family sensor histidine kinase
MMQQMSIWKNREAWFHLAGWILFTLIYLVIFSRFWPIKTSFIRTLGNVLPMIFIFYANIFLVNRYLEKKQYVLYLAIVGIIILLLTGLRTQFNLLFPEITYDSILNTEKRGWRLGAFATNGSILLFSTLYQIIQNRNRMERENEQFMARQHEAQLLFLRAQINPHFLFNTLNNIYALAVVRSEKTADMVLKLSNLLRYVIYDGQEKMVRLQREIEQIGAFVELFQMRSEDPLDISFDYEGNVEGRNIEPMILIPIVENCFKHCDFDTNEKAYVRIKLKVEGRQIHFQTENSKNEMDTQKDKVGGVGLDNIRKRLELKYPDCFSLEVDNQPDRFYVNLHMQI